MRVLTSVLLLLVLSWLCLFGFSIREGIFLKNRLYELKVERLMMGSEDWKEGFRARVIADYEKEQESLVVEDKGFYRLSGGHSQDGCCGK